MGIQESTTFTVQHDVFGTVKQNQYALHTKARQDRQFSSVRPGIQLK